jgi:pyruvate kinase
MARKTKIIATLGPAVASFEAIKRLIESGMNCARLNFSHGSHEMHRQFHTWVRQASDDLGTPVAVLQDIQGPRIRVGTFPGGSVVLSEGDELTLLDGPGEGLGGVLHIENLAKARLEKGGPILMSDGLIKLETLVAGGDSVRARVVEGGVLRDHKGVAFPGTAIHVPAITKKDVRDLELGQELGVDYVAASFVKHGDDIAEIKELVAGTPIIAKIESAIGYENLDSILDEAQGAMVARGDLGVELNFQSVPRAQKDILRRANARARISITATEMLESMTASPRPTRAEVTDVTNAVLDGSDAVMLSAETAVGKFPFGAVEAMGRICEEAEASPEFGRGPEIEFIVDEARFASATAQACVDAADNLGLTAIVAFTELGGTARLISKYRPKAMIHAFTPIATTRTRMALYSGVVPLAFGRVGSTDEMIAHAEQYLLDMGLVDKGEGVVMAAGIPPNQSRATNLMKLHSVGSTTVGIPGA